MYDMPMSDNDWQAEDDARTLSEAEVIKSDASRLSKAEAAAKTISERKQKEAEAMKKIATGGMVYDKSPNMGG